MGRFGVQPRVGRDPLSRGKVFPKTLPVSPWTASFSSVAGEPASARGLCEHPGPFSGPPPQSPAHSSLWGTKTFPLLIDTQALCMALSSDVCPRTSSHLLSMDTQLLLGGSGRLWRPSAPSLCGAQILSPVSELSSQRACPLFPISQGSVLPAEV